MRSESSRQDLKLAAVPAEWEVTLRTGERLRVLADGYSVEGAEYVFSMLVEARPRFEIHVLRVPTEIVESVVGG